MMYISKGRFWLFIFAAFFVGLMTHCSFHSDKNVPRERARVLVVPTDKQAAAAELYAKIYKEAAPHTVWAEREAKNAVLTVYGVEK